MQIQNQQGLFDQNLEFHTFNPNIKGMGGRFQTYVFTRKLPGLWKTNWMVQLHMDSTLLGLIFA
jgi:hypothetical protein